MLLRAAVIGKDQQRKLLLQRQWKRHHQQRIWKQSSSTLLSPQPFPSQQFETCQYRTESQRDGIPYFIYRCNSTIAPSASSKSPSLRYRNDGSSFVKSSAVPFSEGTYSRKQIENVVDAVAVVPNGMQSSWIRQLYLNLLRRSASIKTLEKLKLLLFPDQEEILRRWRPMTPLERAQRFPTAMWILVNESYSFLKSTRSQVLDHTEVRKKATWYDQYLQARAEPLSLLLPGLSVFHYGDDQNGVVHGIGTTITASINRSTTKSMSNPPLIQWRYEKLRTILPWRVSVQHRQIIHNFSRMFGLVILWIPPIIGWIPTILCIVAPRQTFTRHFHNHYEIVHFAILEQKERRNVIQKVLFQFFGSSSYGKNVARSEREFLDHFQRFFSFAEETITVKDPIDLYEAIFDLSARESTKRAVTSSFDLDQLPTSLVRNLAAAMGLSTFLKPNIFLLPELNRVLATVVEEDAQLLVEGYDRTQCKNLSDQEVLDACLMRNLPIAMSADGNLEAGPNVVDYEAMRKSLTHHLQTVSLISHHVLNLSQQHQQRENSWNTRFYEQHRQSEQAKQRMGLFLVLLSILQDHFLQKSPNTSTHICSS